MMMMPAAAVGMTVMVAVLLVIVVIVAVLGLQIFGLRIAMHHGFHDLPQGIFTQRQVGRQKTGQPSENQRLHRQRLIALLGIARLAIAARPHQGVGEELVRIGGDGVLVLARVARLFGQQRARMGEEGRVEMILKGGRAVVFEFAAHIRLHEMKGPTPDGRRRRTQ